jgi:ketosteroid isomerase-like protein
MQLRAILLVLAPASVSCATAAPSVPPASPPATSTPSPAALPVLTSADARAGIDAFNRAMIDVTTRMDNAGVLALWEDDGVSLLPSTKPIEGKKAIGAFLADVTAQFPGAHMRSFEMTCSGIEVTVTGDSATEYCDEHQVVDLGSGKAPFDGRGKILFVLHRGTDGTWRVRREMWNQGESGKQGGK